MFPAKYESYIHIIAFSSGKVGLSESGEKYVQIKHCWQAKTVKNDKTKKGGIFH